ncbi:9645_t:CDS:2, partial [Acaulospora colombiana]
IVLASASDLVERQTSDAQFGFEAPENVRVGEPFRVKFCTGTYFKTSTKKIFFTWGQSNTSVAYHVILEELEPNLNSGYLFNTTVFYTNNKLEGPYYFGVLEEINDYYVYNLNGPFFDTTNIELQMGLSIRSPNIRENPKDNYITRIVPFDHSATTSLVVVGVEWGSRERLELLDSKSRRPMRNWLFRHGLARSPFEVDGCSIWSRLARPITVPLPSPRFNPTPP